MEKWAQWRDLLNAGTEDLRPEVVIGELLIAGTLTEDEIFFTRNGGTFRSVGRDIERILPHKLRAQADYAVPDLSADHCRWVRCSRSSPAFTTGSAR